MATQSELHDTEKNNDVQAACLDLPFLQSCLEELDEQLCPKAAGVSEQLESIDEGDASVMEVFLEDGFESDCKTVDETTKKLLAMEKWKTTACVVAL